MFTTFLIALSLNFDTFSVSVVEGAQATKPSIKDSLKVGLFFGIGQALMALFGLFVGVGFRSIIINIDHWIAFVLLSSIGGKMIYDLRTKQGQQKVVNLLNPRSLILLVIATSIDSLIVGITFAFIKGSIVAEIITIGLVTFIVSFVGFYAGKELRIIFKSKIKIIGGLILIAIGIKILIEHLFFF